MERADGTALGKSKSCARQLRFLCAGAQCRGGCESAAGDRFRPEHSDIDILVDFTPGTPDPFDAYFGLKEDLERIIGRRVDLVMAEAVRNPHFAASALAGAVELYAA